MSEGKDLIVKRTIYAGSKTPDFRDGTKIHFHFQSKLCDNEQTMIDDSRKMGKGEPLYLVLGKKFQLEVWEAILQKMAINEVASFKVDKSFFQHSEITFCREPICESHVFLVSRLQQTL
ncbi:unnamed protein product [Acanthoscelides obtectus]|uniref:AIP/AIPL N-terminal FKBP-type PPIase domain-containing protein n=1 Tax=Acanthoscelides obtectus TaxID=200917 RepID=A0A9P0P4G4_ACAOB|nr:unnamed protein product [Acanthoscelides obtectus]CAK1655439.1 AH receptor-interacting protein [Acanthoscelides obtectus]